MTAFNIEYLISARDALTPVLRRAQAQFKSIEKRLNSLNSPVKLKVDTKQAQSQVDKLHRSIAGLKQAPRVGMNIPVTSQGSGSGGFGGYAGVGTNGAQAGLFTRIGAGGAVAAAGIAAAGYAAKEAIGGAITLETAQLGLRKALDMSTEQIKPYSLELRKLSSNLGIAQEDVTNLATQYAKADSSLNPEQLSKITKLTIASAKAWDASGETVLNAFSLMKGIYGQNTEALTKTANTIDLLGDKFGVLSEGYLNDFIVQGGSVAKAIGLSSEGMLAYGSAAGEMQIQAGVAANALKHMNTALSDSASKNPLEKLGLNFDALQKLKPEEKIGKLLSALNAYQGADKAMIASDIIGKNYDDTLLSLAVSSENYQKALSLANDEGAQAGRVFKALDMEADTTQGKIDRERQKVRNFGIAAGDIGAKGLAYLIDKIGEFSTWIQGSSRAAEVFKVALVGIISVINPIAGLGIVLYNVYQSSSALRGAFESLGQVFSPIVDLFGSGGEAGNSLDLVLKGIGAGLAVIVDVVATAIDGLTTLFKMAGNVADMNWSGIVDNAKGFFSRTAERRDKTFTNIRNDWNGTSPVQQAAAASNATKTQAGLHPQAMQAANTQAQAAQLANAAANQTQASAATGAASTVVNAQAAVTQQQAAATQASVGNMFVVAAQQMMVAANQMISAASRPLTVNVGGGSGSMGDQGR